MNTQVGKTFGLALLVAVGILAVMFALGTFSAQKAGADVGSGTLTLTPAAPEPGAPVTVKVGFTVATDVIGDYSTVTISMPGFVLPDEIDVKSVLVQSTVDDGIPNNVEVDGSDIIVEINDLGGDGGTIALGAASITLRRNAGITAPTAADTYTVQVTTDGQAAPIDAGTLTISESLATDPSAGGGGTEVTISGKALEDGTGSLYAAGATNNGTDENVPDESDDAYGDQEFVADVAIEDGAFSITVSAGDLASGLKGWNELTVVDAVGEGAKAYFQVTGTTTITPESVNKGDLVKVELSDWIAATPSTAKIAGGAMDITDENGDIAPITVTDGKATFYIKVGGDVRLGTKTLVLFDSGAQRLDSASIEINSLPLSVNPSVAVPGQVVSVEGSGFETDAFVQSIMVGEEAVNELDDGNEIDDEDTFIVGGGRVVVSFELPDLDDGAHTIKIVDSSDKIGEAEITVPKPAIVVDPATSRRDTRVEVTGTGFPANANITVTYDNDDVGNARSDSSGNWDTSIMVPLEADIGETGNIVATSGEYTAEAEHNLPGSDIVISPETARGGSDLTITGTGFPAYESVKVKVGRLSESNTSANTDEAGDFETTILLPALPVGTHRILVTVGTETATEILTVPSVDAAPETNPAAETFAGITSLVRVWKYDNATQGWEFYDPDPALASAVDYTEAASGDIVWISVMEQETFQGSALYPGWNTHVIQ